MKFLKFVSGRHFFLKNGYLKFNLEKDSIGKRHYKMDKLLGAKKDTVKRILPGKWLVLYLLLILVPHFIVTFPVPNKIGLG